MDSTHSSGKMNMNSTKVNEKHSLQWSMVRMLILGWLFPLCLFTVLMSFYVTTKVDHQIERSIMDSADKAVELVKLQFSESEKASKDASYQGVICDAYEDYKESDYERLFKERVMTFLKLQYQFDSTCSSAILLFPEDMDDIFYALNNSKNGTYKNIEYFEKNVRKDLLDIMRKADTRTVMFSRDNRIYMARNLVNSKFHPYAVLTLELEADSLFEAFADIWGQKNITVYEDGNVFLTCKNETAIPVSDETDKKLDQNHIVYEKGDGRFSHVYVRTKMYQSTFDFAIAVSNAEVYAEKGSITYIFIILLIFMIPLVYMIFMFFHNRVNRPVQEMVNAFDLLRNGQFGIQIEEESNSEEFQYLKNSFNHMSTQLKNQFEKIYKEEIALRDARIMALQSQINPHFLNNTLETINWEARLNENFKVSQMIEALSVMLEASMNRRSQPYNTLVEEMEYVDAYLYIIKQRFGDKVSYEKEIDESLLNVKIPKLIVQPIVENAVEHGMDPSRQGHICIRVYRKSGDVLCIEVEDNGTLSEEDRKKIHRLLTEELDPLNEKHVSLGIRNVARRLTMMYGDGFGLTIDNNEENHTVSTILVKIEEDIKQ